MKRQIYLAIAVALSMFLIGVNGLRTFVRAKHLDDSSSIGCKAYLPNALPLQLTGLYLKSLLHSNPMSNPMSDPMSDLRWWIHHFQRNFMRSRCLRAALTALPSVWPF